MGELLYFKKKDSGLLAQYVESIVDASGLVQDVDFEIASIIVMDNEYDTFSLGGFLGSTSNKLFQDSSGFLEQAKIHLKNRGKKRIYCGWLLLNIQAGTMLSSIR
ncbi:hypothetical protein QJ48_09745 [Paenibacillus sp. A3]|uniref:hypothetical protein n=1 Tax=Paenibacillus sp. A3 TaxID=1337054 RepID=UPI0006D55D0A|nr:hypothetical protein [Paenibacillus sp. A3]KPV59665.1 hypothetical protein QJ48_09745 [Paenibacillus sp. A3]